MRWLIPLTIVLVCSCGSVKQQIDPEDPWSSSFYPFTLNSIETVCVDTLYERVSGSTRPRPYHTQRSKGRIEGFVYEVCLSLSFAQSDIQWDQPFFVEVELSDGNFVEYLLNDEGIILSGELQHDYIIFVESSEGGDSHITLGFLDELDEVEYDRSNPFQSKQMYLR